MLVHSIPGGPFDDGAVRSPEATARLEAQYHLDDPVWQQYLLYLKGVLHGDFGESMIRGGLSVSEVLTERVPTSLELGLAALFVSLVVGVPVGIFAAVRQNRWLDYSLMTGATVAYAVPNFVLALLLILLFGLELGWLPLGGWGSPSQVVLPAIALGLPWSGLIARVVRAALLETLREDYVRTAAAKGLGPANIVIRHAFRNALIPLTTIIAVLAAELIVGGLVIEQIFGIPGVGQAMVESVLGSDYTMTLGLIVFYATLIFAANVLADVSYAILDPRIRLA